AHERLGPEGLARLLALPRRTVSERLAAAGFPPPRRLLTWGRLIVAAHLLEDSHPSADRIAPALDFPSASAFPNICQRHLGATPGDIRARGGAAYVLRALLSEVGAPAAAVALVDRGTGRAESADDEPPEGEPPDDEPDDPMETPDDDPGPVSQ